jgi:uncharacterized protein YhfF
MDWRQLETFSFGDNPALADELAALVLAGKKTATCWAASDGMLTEIGKRMVVVSGSGRPLAVVETVELTRRRFHEVDAAFAHDEGEGDRSLAYWRNAHRRYFGRLGQFAEDMPLLCERFRVVERIAESGEKQGGDAAQASSPPAGNRLSSGDDAPVEVPLPPAAATT